MLIFACAAAATAQRFEAGLTARELRWRKQVLPHMENQEAVAAVDREAREYVSSLGHRLAHAAPGPPAFPYRFILYDDSVGLKAPGFGVLKQTNQAHALPGGIVAVPVGLFAAVDDEGEFAAAIARAVGHVALRHYARAVARGSFSPKTLLFSRMFEREADYAAAAILARAGFNPEALTRYVKNSRASFDTTDRRVGPLEKALSKLPPRTYCPGDSPQFDALKSRMGAKRAMV